MEWDLELTVRPDIFHSELQPLGSFVGTQQGDLCATGETQCRGIPAELATCFKDLGRKSFRKILRKLGLFLLKDDLNLRMFLDGNKDESKVRQEMFPAGNLHCLDTIQNCLQSKSDDVKAEVFLIPESPFRNVILRTCNEYFCWCLCQVRWVKRRSCQVLKTHGVFCLGNFCLRNQGLVLVSFLHQTMGGHFLRSPR